MSNRLIPWIERHYFGMPRPKRLVVGWTALVLCVVLLGAGCYGLGRGVMALGHLCQQLWQGAGGSTAEGEANDEYSGGRRRHRKFAVSQRHPRRAIPSFTALFDDLNDVQLQAARRLGIQPMADRSHIDDASDRLVRLHDTRYYTIEPLTRSVPYLVPDAADFLTDLGRLMQEYNGTASRFIITSVLRTEADVEALRKGNVNASAQSCHCYATTFDIVYTRFDIVGPTWEGQLKLDLARALADMREAGHCYVKYEVKQPCFHVTVRP